MSPIILRNCPPELEDQTKEPIDLELYRVLKLRREERRFIAAYQQAKREAHKIIQFPIERVRGVTEDPAGSS